jgi:NAD-dependent dihydropyrimidine dehydrogenase PreA subunit
MSDVRPSGFQAVSRLDAEVLADVSFIRSAKPPFVLDRITTCEVPILQVVALPKGAATPRERDQRRHIGEFSLPGYQNGTNDFWIQSRVLRSVMKAIFVNSERCVACKSCEVACALNRSSVSKRLPDAIYETPSPLARVRVEDTGADNGFPVQCRHWGDARCLDA